MGNSLWKAIENERWGELERLLTDERSHAIVRTQTCTIRRQLFPKIETKEEVWMLHMLLWKAAPISVVQLILDIDPTQLTKQSLPSQELPLHFAAMNPVPGFNLDSLNLVLKEHPEALQHRSLRGQIPLHVACETLQPTWFVKKLVTIDPSTVEIRDAHDKTAWDILQIKSGSLLYYNNRLKETLGCTKNHESKNVDQNHYETSSPTRKKSRLPASTSTSDHCTPSQKNMLRNKSPGTKGTYLSVTCFLCDTNPATVAIIPCGHLCMCRECASNEEQAKDKTCSICMQSYESHIEIVPTAVSLLATPQRQRCISQ